MSTKQTNDGGTAFPRYGSDPWSKPSTQAGGMTMRDYFAAAALPAVLAAAYTGRASAKDGGALTEEVLARQAYHFADAMLAERAK